MSRRRRCAETLGPRRPLTGLVLSLGLLEQKEWSGGGGEGGERVPAWLGAGWWTGAESTERIPSFGPPSLSGGLSKAVHTLFRSTPGLPGPLAGFKPEGVFSLVFPAPVPAFETGRETNITHWPNWHDRQGSCFSPHHLIPSQPPPGPGWTVGHCHCETSALILSPGAKQDEPLGGGGGQDR